MEIDNRQGRRATRRCIPRPAARIAGARYLASVMCTAQATVMMELATADLQTWAGIGARRPRGGAGARAMSACRDVSGVRGGDLGMSVRVPLSKSGVSCHEEAFFICLPGDVLNRLAAGRHPAERAIEGRGANEGVGYKARIAGRNGLMAAVEFERESNRGRNEPDDWNARSTRS